MNMKKTKTVFLPERKTSLPPIVGNKIEQIHIFTYLGAHLTYDRAEKKKKRREE